MKRILFISTTDINKKDGGGLGQKAYLSSFEKLFPGMVDIIMPEEYLDKRYPNAKGVPKRNFIKSLLSGSIHRYKKYVNEYLQNNHDLYDLCIINGGLYAGDMMEMIHNYGLKILVMHLNFEPQYQMDNKSLLTFGGITPFFIAKNERKAYNNADCNCFMSNADIKLFEEHYGDTFAPSVVVGAYEQESIEPELLLFKTNECKKIAITGSLNTVQTIEGINDFRKNYYSIFHKLCPSWKLVFAGRNPSKEVYDFNSDRQDVIEIIPNPEDMKEIILNADIFLCPTNVGGGIKLRLMDGLRYGRPILVHEVSARGYDCLFDYPFFRVYHDKVSFKRGLCELVEYVNKGYDPNYIRSIYFDYFSHDSGTNRIKEAVSKMGLL